MHDETTGYARVETPLEFLVSSVLFWFYESVPVPPQPHSSVLERQAIRVTDRPQIRPNHCPRNQSETTYSMDLRSRAVS